MTQDQSPAKAQGVSESMVRPLSWIDVLREWFGGERYARDYEYLDANYSDQARRVASYAATLTAALSGAEAKVVGVKALEWKDERNCECSSETVIGLYEVGFDDGWWAQLEGGVKWDWEPNQDPRSYEGPAAAKAAAQADYERRILSCLASLVPAATAQEVTERCAEIVEGWAEVVGASPGSSIHSALCDAAAQVRLSLPATDTARPLNSGEVEDDSAAMTPEEIRLENLKQMAAYAGPIVSLEASAPYYLASCDHCGWIGSSEHCGTDSWGDDSDVYCPRCFASGADCGKVAAALSSAPSTPDGWRKPRLTEKMMRAACKAHFGSDNIDGVSVAVDGADWTFRTAFKRMWRGAMSALPTPPAGGAK